MNITVCSLIGSQVAAAIDDLAGLRIAVFAEWPYLYDGDLAYERSYLEEFASGADGVLVVAEDNGRIVGAATASPMRSQKKEFREPLEALGIPTGNMFYFGESVLLPDYRGQGIGHAFFDHREAQARRFGADRISFAAVIRDADHPARPSGFTSLDGFWRKRGYAPLDGAIMQLAWKDRGEAEDTRKPLQYWMRRL